MVNQTLSRKALNRALLARQMLLAKGENSALDVVEKLVGLQAQQALPPFVGLWTRVAGFELDQLARLIEGREVVRATMMRGTLHLMSARDYARFRMTLQPVLSAGMRSILRERAEQFDIQAIVTHAHRLFRERHRTFADLRSALLDLYPGGDERGLGYAVRTHLPLVSVPDGSAWGYNADAEFAEAESWLGKPMEEGNHLGELVLRYLAAFGPASAADVQAWSGLGGIKDVLEELRPRLVVFWDERKRELFDVPEAPRPGEETPASVRFLPGFDNVILAHADRSRIIADEYRSRVTTKNLLVLPTFLVDGFVAGTWKCSRQRKTASLAIVPFAKLSAATKKQLAKEGEALATFIEPEARECRVTFEET